MAEERKVSAVETIKEASNYLRDPIAAELHNGEDHFGKEAETLLKFHGTISRMIETFANSLVAKVPEVKTTNDSSIWSGPRFPGGN